ncbi:urease accessory protein UreF [Actibacterium sp. XHP0104]|uniref:urease accessory protein UreF n=1 Tax=Actibacterium sp. XHP0104 TaxID=2984335 RepID=UPI0021E91931|nr:urease accessory protein UreF [Actibacterium sp. XHP0104]MCV2880748.1 urease accessory protein UreF [Actibacterium sp. XHP0104]
MPIETGANADLLTLVQWLSPAFPLGSFAYSHGLEHAISVGLVRDAAALGDWLATVLQEGSGAVDATLLCLAQKGGDADHLADMARALAASRERLEESQAQGRAFVSTVNQITGSDHPARPLPVAVGVAARRLGLPPAQVAALYLHAFASNLVSAAVRFVPLGQTEGQRVLAQLHQPIQAVASRAATAGLPDLTSAALGADLSAMRHEDMDVRIFRT